MTICEPKSGASHRAIWAAAQHLGLYALTDAELAALIQMRGGSSEPGDQVAAEAAQYVRRLRNGMARGDSC